MIQCCCSGAYVRRRQVEELTFSRPCSEFHGNDVVAEERLDQIVDRERDQLERRHNAERHGGATATRKGTLRDDGCDALVSRSDFDHL